MSERRMDVRGELLMLGWVPSQHDSLRRGRASFFASRIGDATLSQYKRPGQPTFTITFPSDVPAHVIVAACEAAAKGERRALSPKSGTDS